jgi:hypothetical protein
LLEKFSYFNLHKLGSFKLGNFLVVTVFLDLPSGQLEICAVRAAARQHE